MRRSQKSLHSPRLKATHPQFSDRDSPLTIPKMRARQKAKIGELAATLKAAGLFTLDKQAEALALSRSTTWTLLNGNHKGSGLSVTIINRMLVSPRLPRLVRATILEYVAEKSAGRYGDSKVRLRKFTARLSVAALEQTCAVEGRRWSAPCVSEMTWVRGESRTTRASRK